MIDIRWFVPAFILMFYILYKIIRRPSKKMTLKDKVKARAQLQEDKKQRALDRMPTRGYFVFHLSPAGSELSEGYIGMTNNLALTKKIYIEKLLEGDSHSESLQRAWNLKEFTADDFQILFENLSGKRACKVVSELRPHDYMGWNYARGGWGWNDPQFHD